MLCKKFFRHTVLVILDVSALVYIYITKPLALHVALDHCCCFLVNFKYWVQFKSVWDKYTTISTYMIFLRITISAAAPISPYLMRCVCLKISLKHDVISWQWLLSSCLAMGASPPSWTFRALLSTLQHSRALWNTVQLGIHHIFALFLPAMLSYEKNPIMHWALKAKISLGS